MPEMFSCTLALRSSYFVNATLNIFIALSIIITRTAARKTIAPRNIKLISAFTTKHITILLISIRGALTAILIII